MVLATAALSGRYFRSYLLRRGRIEEDAAGVARRCGIQSPAHVAERSLQRDYEQVCKRGLSEALSGRNIVHDRPTDANLSCTKCYRRADDDHATLYVLCAKREGCGYWRKT